MDDITPSLEIKKHHIQNSLSKTFNGNLAMNDFETRNFSNDAHLAWRGVVPLNIA